jgi:creatinine amidohydrolase/Fe(II)-dependent formamide hydrolase-like protein
MKLLDMTWKEVLGRKTVVIPVGSIEQHGPHLPLSTDALIAKAVAGEVALKLRAVLAPAVIPGVSIEHMDFLGTITVSKEVFIENLMEICVCFKHHGFKKIIVVNGHGGNQSALEAITIAGMKYVDIVRQIKGYDHAGAIETSLMLYLHPEKVRKDRIRKQKFIYPGKKEWRTIDYSKSGVLGDPTQATPEKGEKYFKQIVSGIMKELQK